MKNKENENEEKRNIIVKLIQASLVGKIDPSSNFNPQFLADAIIKKLEFNRPIKEINAQNVSEVIGKVESWIGEINKDMNNELEQLGEDEKLLGNFIKGQKTTCDKLKNKLKTI